MELVEPRARLLDEPSNDDDPSPLLLLELGSCGGWRRSRKRAPLGVRKAEM